MPPPKGVPSMRPREFQLALAAGGLIACWGILSFLVQPLWERRSGLRVEIETAGQRYKAFTELLAQAPDIQREYHAIAPYLEMHSEQAQGAFLTELETLSRQSQLRLNLKPRTARQDPHLSRFEVELDVEGPQADVLAFLDAVLAMPRLIAVERLRIASIPTKEQLLRANLVVQKLSLR